MIEIKKLVKTYENGNNRIVALDHIDLVLPDVGMVFIIGKSGCGKSTLLNMLGGLDDITSGDILFDGRSITKLSENELANFRSDTVSTIYQNFHLFPNETVYQNVIIASRLFDNGNSVSETIDKTLDNLGLLDKKKTKVQKLSGGQKQRVAIARALVKDTPIILADEPTGNLDSKNTKIIFDILKEISKEKLVIVVSHDIKSAETYADRLISISDGHIIDDKTRNQRPIKTYCKKIVLPEDNNIPIEDIEEINRILIKHRFAIEKSNGVFKKTSPKIACDASAKRYPQKKRKYQKVGGSFSYIFFKSSKSSFVVTVVILSILVAMLAFAKNFIEFDANGAISVANNEYNAKAYTMFKGYSFYDDISTINKNYLIECTDDDKNMFYASGYEGNIYELYNFCIGNSNTSAYCTTPAAGYDAVYTGANLGVAVVDLDYLEKIFGEVDILAGSLYNLDKSDSVIVTDYFADTILENYKVSGYYTSEDPHDKYQKITNCYFGEGSTRYRIGAIINTRYTERYNYLIEQFDKAIDEPQNAEDIKRDLQKNPISNAFVTEVDTALNIAYSINPNFEQTILNMTDVYSSLFTQNMQILNVENGSIVTANYKKINVENAESPLSQGEMLMGVSSYKSLFGKNVSSSAIGGFEDKDITLKFLRYDQDSREDEGLVLNLKVVGVFDDSSDSDEVAYLSTEDYKLVKDNLLYPSAFLFDNVAQCYDVYSVGKPAYFYTNISVYNTIFTICDIIGIFEDIFIFIFVALLIIATLLIVFHNTRLIKRNQYFIGVCKSLGYHSSVFALASTLNCIFLDVVVYGMSVLISFVTSKLVNVVLTESFAKFLNFNLVKSMTLVGFSIEWISIYVCAVLVMSFVSLLVPILSVRKLKPNLILNKSVE